MSFILDALKKSDQQRQQSATPTLTTAQIPAEQNRQPVLLWYGLLAAVLLGSGVLIGWMHQSPSEPGMPSLPGAGRPPGPEAQKFVAAVPQPASPETARKPAVLREPPDATALPPAEARHAAPLKPVPAVASLPKAEEQAKAIAGDPAKGAEAMAMSELPPTIQQELPKLAILAHSYSSKPKARFVFINDQMVHEEESPAPGLKLEQITPDGMIFSYKGYRFRRGANQ